MTVKIEQDRASASQKKDQDASGGRAIAGCGWSEGRKVSQHSMRTSFDTYFCYT